MPSQTCLTSRRNSVVPQFRRAIPADLWDVFGRRELGGSLQTRLHAEAKRRRNALVAATDSIFEDARVLSATGAADRTALLEAFRRQRTLICAGQSAVYVTEPEKTEAADDSQSAGDETYWPPMYEDLCPNDEFRPVIKPHFSLKPAMIPRLLSRRRAVMLQCDELLRAHDSRDDLKAMRTGLEELEQDTCDDVVRGDTSAIREDALTLLAYEGIDVSRTQAEHLAQYLSRFLSAELELIREQLGHLNGSRTPIPELPVEPLDTDDWETFIATWQSVRKPKATSVSSVRSEISRFKGFTHDKSPVDITADDVREYVDFLLKSVSRARAKTILSLIRPVIATAITERITSLKSNPFDEISVEVSEKDVRSYQPFSASQLQAFFNGPVHRAGDRPAKGGKEAAFWLPLLSIYAGVRLEEAGTLTTSSILERSGRYWIQIGHSKTTNSSLREIPLHRVLEEKGFVEFAQTQRRVRGANAPLFVHLKQKNIDTKKTRMFSTWVNEYIDRYVIDDRQYTYHSFRNNFEDALTCEGVAEDVRRALMGHAQSGMTRRYGKKSAGNRRVFPDRALIEAMDRLTYEGLNLNGITAESDMIP